MGNIYIETDENFRVTKIHRMPFDPNNGMGYTREELEQKGYFVDEVPEPIHKVGRRSIAMYNPDTKSIYYEYVGIPESDKERIDYLENALNAVLTTIYAQPIAQLSLMSLNEENDTTIGDVVDESQKINDMVGEYLAHQIISGKLDATECINKYPDSADTIKSVLMDNGIQI